MELLQTLLKMAPTAEEELKLRLFSGNLSQLGPAERFLKVLVDIPFAFKRLESLLFMGSLQEDISMLKESFATLEVSHWISELQFLFNSVSLLAACVCVWVTKFEILKENGKCRRSW